MSSKRSAISDIKNFFFDTRQQQYPMIKESKDSNVLRRNLSFSISPSQFARIKHDVGMWREAVIEAENAYYPFRVRMQRIFQDTILNEHVYSCWERRKDMTMLRDYKIGPEDGEGDDEIKKVFQQMWFSRFVSYALDALAYGYSLISLGDLVMDKFPDLALIRRQNISPDRLNVTTWPNIVAGSNFMDPEYTPWHIWIPTPSELGVSPCGFGFLYKVAKTEIYLRNNTSYNADFQEIFGQPLRKGKTSKTAEDERAKFASDLANMGSNPWILLDDGLDDVEFVESKQIGASYKSFADFEKRQEQKISKVILGHADAMDSTPGKLGGTQGTENESPSEKAMMAKQMKDGQFIEDIINGQLLPRMQNFGFKIPATYRFQYVNNNEEEELREREDESNAITADIFATISQAGGKPDWGYFSKRTGIPVTEAPPPPAPVMPGAKPGAVPVKKDPKLTQQQKNSLERIYKTKTEQ